MILLWQEIRKTRPVALSSYNQWFMPPSWNDYSEEDKTKTPNKSFKKHSVMCV